jgi:hypothetical protein
MNKILQSLMLIPVLLFTIISAYIGLFGGVVGAIWLAILGEWKIIVFGILGLVIGKHLIAFALVPSNLLLLHGSQQFEKEQKVVGILYALIAGMCSSTLLALWCLSVLFLCLMKGVASDSFLPAIIFSYTVAISPLASILKAQAQSELRTNGHINNLPMQLFGFLQLAYLISIVLIYFYKLNFSIAVFTFIIIMSFSTLLQGVKAFTLAKE